MQAAKTLLTLLALGLCVGTVSQARPDTEAQAKAREALRKKMAELDGQPATPAPPAAPAPAAPAKPAKAPKATPPPQPTPPPQAVAAPVAAAPVAAAPAAGTATPEQIERLRESTRQKIAELNAQGKSAPASVATPPPAAVAATPPAAPDAPAPPAKSAAEIRAEEKAAAAEAKRLAEEDKARQKAEAEAAKAKEAAEAKAAAAQAKSAPKGPTFDPIPAPPSNLAESKETRLADLLKKYKAEEITPEQYHTERAKILAEK